MRKLDWMVLVGLVALGASGCVVTTGDDDDDACLDSDADGICDSVDCDPGDPTNTSAACQCPDADGDGVCDAADCAPNDPAQPPCDCSDRDGDGYCDTDDCYPDDPSAWACDCVDTDGDLVCDVDDCYPDDPSAWECDCPDADWDGVCDADDCYPNDYRIWDCSCEDYDGDTVCDDVDKDDCVDDLTGDYLCAEPCTAADNICTDPWQISYCVEGVFYLADCADSCVNDDRVYGQTCGGIPAITGECSPDDGACLCWCEDSFDSCVDDWTVQYTRDGTTYQVHCGQYCGGTCDAGAGACACP